jgi:hypothetical protein
MPQAITTTETNNDTLNIVVKHEKNQTPLEGMMAPQLVTLHHMTQNFANRMNNDGIVNRATKIIRTSTALMETLIKSRNQGKQVIQVQHVTVNEGGQASR